MTSIDGSHSNLELAGGPVSWGVDFADAPGNPPYEDVLTGVAAADLSWIELGPVGYLPQDRTLLAAHGLSVAGTFVFEALHDPSARPGAIRRPRGALSAVAATGGGCWS